MFGRFSFFCIDETIINPISGFLLSFVQLPLLFAFYEAINRTPAIFEDKFLFLELGKTPGVAIQNGEWHYIILISSFSMASGVGVYWVTSNIFTILQNLIVERKKVK